MDAFNAGHSLHRDLLANALPNLGGKSRDTYLPVHHLQASSRRRNTEDKRDLNLDPRIKGRGQSKVINIKMLSEEIKLF